MNQHVKRCKYRIVTSPDMTVFQEKCDAAAKDGFFPHGDPFWGGKSVYQAFRRDVRVPSEEANTWEA